MTEPVHLTHDQTDETRQCWICGQSARYYETLGKKHKPRYLCTYHWNLTYNSTAATPTQETRMR